MKYVILVKEEITCETPCNDRGGRIAGTGELPHPLFDYMFKTRTLRLADLVHFFFFFRSDVVLLSLHV
jgi:hypothetical protein